MKKLDPDFVTTSLGVVRGGLIGGMTVVLAQDPITFWMGLVLAVLTTLNGYFTNK